MVKKLTEKLSSMPVARLARISLYAAMIPFIGMLLAVYCLYRSIIVEKGGDAAVKDRRRCIAAIVWSTLVWVSVPCCAIAWVIGVWKVISKYLLTKEQNTKVRAFTRAKLNVLSDKIQSSVRKTLDNMQQQTNPEPSNEENPSSPDGGNQE